MLALIVSFIVLLAFSLVPDAAAQPIKLNVAHAAIGLHDISFYVAREKGFYHEEGLSLQSIFVRGGPMVVQTLVAGDISFAINFAAVPQAGMTGVPVKGIMAFNEKPIFTLYARKESAIGSLAELKGKKVAITAVGSATDYALRAMLKAEGIDPSSVAILPVGGGINIWGAIQSGVIDAAVLWPPFFAMAEREGMRKLRYLGDVISYPTSGVSTSDQMLRENPALVHRVLKASVKGLRYFQDPKNKSEMVGLITRLFKLDRELALKNYDFIHSIQTKDGFPSPAGLKTHMSVVKDAVRRLAAEPEEKLMRQGYDFGPLKEVLRERF